MNDLENLISKWETEYKKGFSKIMIIFCLSKKENYAYQLTKDISEATNGKIIIAGSNIYPVLSSMEDEGLIKKEKDPNSRRSFYYLTEFGKQFLEVLIPSLNDFLDMISNMITTTGVQ